MNAAETNESAAGTAAGSAAGNVAGTAGILAGFFFFRGEAAAAFRFCGFAQKHCLSLFRSYEKAPHPAQSREAAEVQD